MDYIERNDKKKKAKTNSREISKISNETKWPKQSVKTYNQPRKHCLSQQKLIKLLISAIELHGDKNQSIKETVEKIFFSKGSLKVTKTNCFILKG